MKIQIRSELFEKGINNVSKKQFDRLFKCIELLYFIKSYSFFHCVFFSTRSDFRILHIHSNILLYSRYFTTNEWYDKISNTEWLIGVNFFFLIEVREILYWWTWKKCDICGWKMMCFSLDGKIILIRWKEMIDIWLKMIFGKNYSYFYHLFWKWINMIMMNFYFDENIFHNKIIILSFFLFHLRFWISIKNQPLKCLMVKKYRMFVCFIL